MPRLVGQCSTILQVRDARLPLLTGMSVPSPLANLPLITIFTHADLVSPACCASIRRHFKFQKVAFISPKISIHIPKLFHINERMIDPLLDYEHVVGLIGLPNVGKSTLLNRLRNVGLKKGKIPAAVNSKPGWTRNVGTRVKVWQGPPIIYVLDAPGIMEPTKKMVQDVNQRSLLGLIGCIPSNAVDLIPVLLEKLQQHCPEFHAILNLKDTTWEMEKVLEDVAIRFGMIKRGGEPDLERSAKYLVSLYRSGRFGTWMLETIPT